MEIKTKIYSGVFTNRCTFEPLNKNTDKNEAGKFGVRCHSDITTFFLRLFCCGDKLIDVKNSSGKVIHLNKGSLDNWIDKHLHYTVKKWI